MRTLLLTLYAVTITSHYTHCKAASLENGKKWINKSFEVESLSSRLNALECYGDEVSGSDIVIILLQGGKRL